jgi:hypothetical protein
MNYKIPDHIKFLCDKGDLSNPDEQELVKQELVKFLTDYLDLKKGKNSLANITDIVSEDGEFPVKGTVYPFERDVAGRMMRTRNYTMKEGTNKVGKEEVYIIAADRDWWDKNKLWFTLITSAAGIIIGIMADPLKGIFNNRSKEQYYIKDTIQVRLQNNSHTLLPIDTVYNLKIEKKDSTKHD